MKKMILAFTMMCSTQAFATTTVLRCNIPSGDLQEIHIVSRNGQLILKELDSSGSQHERAISAEEIAGGQIKLTTRDADTKGTLTKTRDGWAFEFTSSGFRDVGLADCY